MKTLKILPLAAIMTLPLFTAQSYAETVTKTYTYSYDQNADGIITPDEFTTYVYRQSDVNRDNFLEDDEWNMTTTRWYKPYNVESQTYTYWDTDKDSRLSSMEVNELVTKTGLYSKWDVNTDGQLSDQEFRAGTFKAYDDDADGSIDIAEWQDVLR
jgi:Ca2+-binding EF-hand superfamily protein